MKTSIFHSQNGLSGQTLSTDLNTCTRPDHRLSHSVLRSRFPLAPQALFSMYKVNTTTMLLLGALVLLASFSGCNKQSDTPTTAEAETPEVDAMPVVPPTVSIEAPEFDFSLSKPAVPQQDAKQTAMAPGAQQPQSQNRVEPIRSEKGTVEWLVEEIAILQSRTNNAQKSPATEAEQIEQLHSIIELAQQVIVKTHQDPQKVATFNNGVHALADARLLLAIAGDAEQARLLSEDADVLYAKDPKSYAAAESAFKLMQFTQVQAQAKAAKEAKWGLAFARQARLFASKFPQETNRAAIHLVAAGRICDKIGQTDEAKNCLLVVEERFPESPFSDQVKNSLRRLRLPGQELLEFGGTTLDGKHLSIEQFRGRPTIIAFWASNSIVFKEDMARIDQIVASTGGKAAVIGVNLDRDAAAVEKFIGVSGNNWPHIFYSAPNKRGMDNLIAKYYGVTKVPSYWLIDASGVVKTINLDPQELPELLAQMNIAAK